MARKTRRSLRGSALVEVGIIILPLVTISFAVTGNTVNDSSGAALPRDQAIRQAMRAATPGFQIADNAFTFYNVSKGTSDTGGPKDVIRVTVTYDWQLLTPILQPFFPSGHVTVRVASTMRNEPFRTQ